MIKVVALVAFAFCSVSIAAPPDTKETFIYVGTYTNTPSASKGIYVYRLQTTKLEVSQNITFAPMGLAVATPSPSYLVAEPKRRLIFAVNELDTYDGKPTGSVSSFAVKPDATLQPINTQPSGGAGPCHCVLDGTGKWLAVANYNGGSFELLPVAADGKLGEPTTVIKFDGATPKTHCTVFSPDNKFLFVCCLGLDKVMSYKFDATTGKVTPNDPAYVEVKKGAGPRHIVFRQDGQFAYVINELNSTIVAFSYDATAGALKEIQTVSTLPGYYDGPNTCAEIAIHPNQKFLYGSNRGNDTIVLFEIDPKKGTLIWVEEQSTGGKTPRQFGIQPNAKHMAIINQYSDTVLASRIDAGNGRLKPSGVFAKCPSPACAIFMPPPGELTMTGGVTGD